MKCIRMCKEASPEYHEPAQWNVYGVVGLAIIPDGSRPSWFVCMGSFFTETTDFSRRQYYVLYVHTGAEGKESHDASG